MAAASFSCEADRFLVCVRDPRCSNRTFETGGLCKRGDWVIYAISRGWC